MPPFLGVVGLLVVKCLRCKWSSNLSSKEVAWSESRKVIGIQADISYWLGIQQSFRATDCCVKLFVGNICVSKDSFDCFLRTPDQCLKYTTKMAGTGRVKLLVNWVIFACFLCDSVRVKGLHQPSKFALCSNEVGSIVRDNIGRCPPP